MDFLDWIEMVGIYALAIFFVLIIGIAAIGVGGALLLSVTDFAMGIISLAWSAL